MLFLSDDFYCVAGLKVCPPQTAPIETGTPSTHFTIIGTEA
jgi:hypothetical protein